MPVIFFSLPTFGYISISLVMSVFVCACMYIYMCTRSFVNGLIHIKKTSLKCLWFFFPFQGNGKRCIDSSKYDSLWVYLYTNICIYIYSHLFFGRGGRERLGIYKNKRASRASHSDVSKGTAECIRRHLNISRHGCIRIRFYICIYALVFWGGWKGTAEHLWKKAQDAYFPPPPFQGNSWIYIDTSICYSLWVCLYMYTYERTRFLGGGWKRRAEYIYALFFYFWGAFEENGWKCVQHIQKRTAEYIYALFLRGFWREFLRGFWREQLKKKYSAVLFCTCRTHFVHI